VANTPLHRCPPPRFVRGFDRGGGKRNAGKSWSGNGGEGANGAGVQAGVGGTAVITGIFRRSDGELTAIMSDAPACPVAGGLTITWADRADQVAGPALVFHDGLISHVAVA